MVPLAITGPFRIEKNNSFHSKRAAIRSKGRRCHGTSKRMTHKPNYAEVQLSQLLQDVLAEGQEGILEPSVNLGILIYHIVSFPRIRGRL